MRRPRLPCVMRLVTLNKSRVHSMAPGSLSGSSRVPANNYPIDYRIRLARTAPAHSSSLIDRARPVFFLFLFRHRHRHCHCHCLPETHLPRTVQGTVCAINAPRNAVVPSVAEKATLHAPSLHRHPLTLALTGVVAVSLATERWCHSAGRIHTRSFWIGHPTHAWSRAGGMDADA